MRSLCYHRIVKLTDLSKQFILMRHPDESFLQCPVLTCLRMKCSAHGFNAAVTENLSGMLNSGGCKSLGSVTRWCFIPCDP